MSKNEAVNQLNEEYVDLHRSMVKYYLDLFNGDKPIKATELDAARKFLRDNHITLPALAKRNTEQQLDATDDIDDLPFPVHEEGGQQ